MLSKKKTHSSKTVKKSKGKSLIEKKSKDKSPIEKKSKDKSLVEKKSNGKSLIEKKSKNKNRIHEMTVANVHKKDLNSAGYKDFEDWASHSNHLYIGRNMNFYVKGALPSKWANPFSSKKYTRSESLRLYEKYIRESELYDQLEELEGKILGCWCAPLSCHGDVLVKLLKEKSQESLEI